MGTVEQRSAIILLLALCSNYGDNKENMDFFQITCLYKKQRLPVITWNRKHLSK